MKRKICTLVVLFSAAVMLLAVGGCRHTLYVLFGSEEKRDIPAEFGELPGHSVAIVVFSDPQVQYEFPMVGMRLAQRIAVEMESKLKKVRIVEQQRVVKFQAQNLSWEVMDKTAIGKALGADYVMFVSIMRYTNRDAGSFNLYRANIAAEVSLYDSGKSEHEAMVWQTGDLSVTHPKDASPGQTGSAAERILNEAERQFVELLVKKFYDHHKDAVTE